jgi:hypothetical protein
MSDAKRIDSRDDLLADVAPRLMSPAAEPKQRMGIDMESLAKAERNPEATSADVIAQRLDAQVLVVFELPDGSEAEETFKLGQTVEVLKAFVADEFEIPMAGCRLYLGEAEMFDPLSLSDFPGVSPRKACVVRVAGEVPDRAQKK